MFVRFLSLRQFCLAILICGGLFLLSPNLFASDLQTTVEIINPADVEEEEQNEVVQENNNEGGGGAVLQKALPIDPLTGVARQLELRVEIVAMNENHVRIEWKTDQISKSTFRYGFDENYDLGTIESISYMDTHEIEMSALLPGRTYYYYIEVQSLEGMKAEARRFFTLEKEQEPESIFDVIQERQQEREEIFLGEEADGLAQEININEEDIVTDEQGGVDGVLTPEPEVRLIQVLVPPVEEVFVEDVIEEEEAPEFIPERERPTFVPGQVSSVLTPALLTLSDNFEAMAFSYPSYFFAPVVNTYSIVSVFASVAYFVGGLF